MRSRVTEQGVLIPKQLLEDVEEVEIRKEHRVIVVIPVASQDPVFGLGTEPIADDLRDASERHDDYLYGRTVVNRVFLDTGYLLALELANDQNHVAAVTHWRLAFQEHPRFVLTSYVFDETVTLFNSRGHHRKAVEVGSRLLQSDSVELIHVDEGLFYEAWSYFQTHQDKRYSLTDCVSFVAMQKLGISVAYSFDKHFEQAGFIREP